MRGLGLFLGLLRRPDDLFGLSSFNIVVDPSKAGSAAGDFVLPCNGAGYNAIIDWGDGSGLQTITGSPGNVSHTYAGYTSGTYTVRIKELSVGGFPTIYFNDGGDRLKLMQISQWGTNKWVTLSSSFKNCPNLTITATDGATANTGNVTDFTSAWLGCSGLTSFPALNTSSGTNFGAAWYGCTGLTIFPTLDTSKGTNFNSTWQACTGLTSFPALNAGLGTDFTNAWYQCTGLTSFSSVDTSKGINFTRTWYGCNKLTSFPALNTSSGTTFYETWRDCTGLTSFSTLDTSSGTSFYGAWVNCNKLTSFPSLDTSKGTNFTSAWYGCSGLTSFPALNAGLGTDFTNAWYGCSGLTSFPSVNISSGIIFYQTWYGCSGLTSFPALDTSKGTTFAFAWQGCTGLGGYAFPALDMHLMSNGASCFAGWAMSKPAYNAILDQLANGNGGSIPANTTTSTVFSGGNSRYDTGPPDGVAARLVLTGTRTWTITDGGTP
jgi:hypothetical protein